MNLKAKKSLYMCEQSFKGTLAHYSMRISKVNPSLWQPLNGTPTQYVKTKYIGDKVYRTKYISNEGSWRLRTSTTLCTRNKTSSEHSTGLTMYVSDKVYNKQTKLATNWTINIFLNFISNYYKKIYFRNSYES